MKKAVCECKSCGITSLCLDYKIVLEEGCPHCGSQENTIMMGQEALCEIIEKELDEAEKKLGVG